MKSPGGGQYNQSSLLAPLGLLISTLLCSFLVAGQTDTCFPDQVAGSATSCTTVKSDGSCSQGCRGGLITSDIFRNVNGKLSDRMTFWVTNRTDRRVTQFSASFIEDYPDTTLSGAAAKIEARRWSLPWDVDSNPDGNATYYVDGGLLSVVNSTCQDRRYRLLVTVQMSGGDLIYFADGPNTVVLRNKTGRNCNDEHLVRLLVLALFIIAIIVATLKVK